MSDPTIKARCPQCQSEFDAPAAAQGGTARCPACGSAVPVPRPREEGPSPADAASGERVRADETPDEEAADVEPEAEGERAAMPDEPLSQGEAAGQAPEGEESPERRQKTTFRLDVLDGIIEDLNSHPRLQAIFGTPVSAGLVVVAEGGDLRVEDAGAAAGTAGDKQEFVRVLGLVIEANTTGDRSKLDWPRGSAVPPQPPQPPPEPVPAWDDTEGLTAEQCAARDELDEKLRRADKALRHSGQPLVAGWVAGCGVLLLLSWLFVSWWKAALFVGVVGGAAYLVVCYMVAQRQRDLLEGRHREPIDAQAPQAAVTRSQLNDHIQRSYRTLARVW